MRTHRLACDDSSRRAHAREQERSRHASDAGRGAFLPLRRQHRGPALPRVHRLPRQSLRPWADYLAAAGLTVSLPRLPGHGTTWQEMARTRWEDWYAEIDRAYSEELRGARRPRSSSWASRMGACLALRLAEQRGAEVGRAGAGEPVDHRRHQALPAGPGAQVRRALAQGGRRATSRRKARTELSYDRVPVRAAASLPQLWRLTQAAARRRHPARCWSYQEHRRPCRRARPACGSLRPALPAGQLTVRDARIAITWRRWTTTRTTIFAGSLEFVRAHSRRRAGWSGSGTEMRWQVRPERRGGGLA